MRRRSLRAVVPVLRVLLLCATLVLPHVAAASTPTALRARLAAPASGVSDSRSVFVTVTLENAGDEAQSVLRRFTPFTSFADGPAFVVERDGEPVAYQGRMVKYAPPSADDFLTLAPGQARTVSVDLGALYDFSQPGTYTVRLRAAAQGSAVRAAVGTASAAREWQGTFESEPVTVAIAPQAARPFVAPYAAERIAIPAQSQSGSVTYVGCSAGELTAAQDAVVAACAMASRAYAASCSRGSADTDWVWWFGAWNSARCAVTHQHYLDIMNRFCSLPFTFWCHGPDCFPGVYAYVYPAQVPPTVYVCDGFWGAPMTGVDTKPGTLIHEMSHVLSGTDDWAYGQSEAHTLAVNNPALAIDNADNHEYYGEANPVAPLAVAPGALAATLRPARPNPSLGGAALEYALTSDGDVELSVWSLDGRLVRTVERGWRAAGEHHAAWDGLDASGRRAPAGVYFVRLTSATESRSQRLVMLR